MKIKYFFHLIPAFFFFTTNLQAQAQASVVDSTTGKDYKLNEVAASVDIEEWRAHLIKELNKVVKYAGKKLSEGTYTVNVRFLVEKDGTISNVQPLNDLGYKISEKIAEVVESGPKWKPGTRNGNCPRG